MAREPGHPQGSTEDRYTLVLPLGPEGRIDADYCRDFPDFCRVAHASSGGGIHRGLLWRDSDGAWVFDYGDADDVSAIGFRFERERFMPGEYVSVIRNGRVHPYRAMSL